MKEYEATECIHYLDFVDRTERELARYQLLVSINSISKHQVKPEEIMKLPWDDRWLDKMKYEYNEDDAEYLEDKSDDMLAMLNKGLVKFEEVDMMKSDTKNIENNK